VEIHRHIPRGFSFYINKCNDEQAWLFYMTKSRLTLEQIKKIINIHIYNESEAKNHNNFVAEQSGSGKYCPMLDLEELIEINPFDQRNIIE